MKTLALIIGRIATHAGEDPAALLRRLYCDELKTPHEIGRALKIDPNRTVPKLLTFFGIPKRSRAEAIALQWKRNPKRSKSQSKRMTERMKKFYRTHEHWAQGLTKETHPGIASTAEKLKQVTSAHRPEVRAKMTATRIAQHRKNPSSHMNAKVPMSKWETVFAGILETAGIRYDFNASFPPYWVDFYLPDFKVGIECYRNRGEGKILARHTAIEAQGVTLYYLNNCNLKPTWSGGRAKGPHTREQGGDVIASLLQGIKTGTFSLSAPREHFLFDRKPLLSKWHIAFAEILKQHGILHECQASFPPYFVDFYLPNFRIGVDLYQAGARNKRIIDTQRQAILEAQGVILYYLSAYHLRSTWSGGRPKSQKSLPQNSRILASLLQGIQTGTFNPRYPREHFLLERKKPSR